ncbi:MAG: TerC family protein [Coxiellaceae bacterium]|nr:TerC family protein [Coxiellaceae bacterium]
MPLWLWLSFFLLIGIVLSVDLFLLGNKKNHRISVKEALSWSIIWFLCAGFFVFFLWHYLLATTDTVTANQKSLEFIAGYFIEKSLSIDNIFVILMIFTYFKIPQEYQRRVLLYGIIGAIVMRFLFIFSGVYLVQKFAWILYIFGAILIFSGIKMFFHSDDKKSISENFFLQILKKTFRVTEKLQEDKFFVKKNRWVYITPLFLALILVEISDFIFAFDSIPAIFAITQDPFIIFTSNIFAILGLRSLYFLLTHLKERFQLLHYGLAFILCFIGVKMLIVDWVHISTGWSLGVIMLTLLLTFCFSQQKR